MGKVYLALLLTLAHWAAQAQADTVRWYDWESAVAAHEKAPKKLFVDVYTTWCGPCKLMDQNTFSDPRVAAYLNAHFYPVKLDAEHKGDLHFKGHTFQWVPTERRGVNLLAYSLLDKQLRYPSAVFLDEQFVRQGIESGYMLPDRFLALLQRYAEAPAGR